MPAICASVRQAASRAVASNLAIAHRSWGERPAAAALSSDNIKTPIAGNPHPLTRRFASLFCITPFLPDPRHEEQTGISRTGLSGSRDPAPRPILGQQEGQCPTADLEREGPPKSGPRSAPVRPPQRVVLAG